MAASLFSLRASANSFLSQYEPLFLVFFPLLALFTAWIIHFFFQLVGENGLRAAFLRFFLSSIKLIPGVHNYIEREKSKVVEKLQSSSKSKKENWQTELPRVGLGRGVVERLETEKRKDVVWQGRCSGTIYIGGNESEGHFSLTNEAYSMFSHTNPLHRDVFQSIARFEAEVVSMTAAFLGSKEKTSGGQICGNMTSGGTESILLAVKSSRDYMKMMKGITRPEMIIPESAHSAYDKAAQYFNIKLWRVPVNKEFEADVKEIRRFLNRNTILIIGSAPGFPHGIIDPIEELGELASRVGICFHVDLCLGGFVLPFARKLGYQLPPFDFSVDGVTSISVDVHKYGLGPKGTSVVLYRNHEIRKHQFVAVTEWSGGLYVSPTIAGSRSGGLIAGAWTAMMSLGLEGHHLINITEVDQFSGEDKGRSLENLYGWKLLAEAFPTVPISQRATLLSLENGSLENGPYQGYFGSLQCSSESNSCSLENGYHWEGLGYLENTKQIMETSKRIQNGIKEIPELFIIGRPDMTIVAFGSIEVDIFEVNDIMSSRGWHLNALQRPSSIHICVTLQHVPVVEDFLKDLRGSIKAAKENPGSLSGGLAPIYGAAEKMPDRGMVQELLVSFMDGTC